MIPPINHDFQSSGEQSSVVMKLTRIFLIFPVAPFTDDFPSSNLRFFRWFHHEKDRVLRFGVPGTFGVKAHAVLAVAQEQAAIAGGESYSDLWRAIEEMDG